MAMSTILAKTGMLSHERRDDYNIPVFAEVSSSPPNYGLPFTLDQLLSSRAKVLSNLSTVVVLGANMGYFDLLLNKVLITRVPLALKI